MQIHRIDIDGLRAFAIIPVIIFHMGFDLAPAGFLGVDVFFVISGFLITGILISELETTGRINLTKFYERRIRRILPGLFVVIFVSFIGAYFVLLPDDFFAFRESAKYSIASISNVYFLGASDYFATDSDLFPLLHTWSLAVEEQFYLLFPILLWGFFKFLGRGLLLGALSLGFVASLSFAQMNLQDSSAAAFYLIQFRAWELVAGSIALIYFTKIKYTFRVANLLSIGGLVILVASYVFFPGDFQHPGIATLIPIIATVLVIVFSRPNTLAFSLLSTKPFVSIGLLSYSLYLWHQPVFALVRAAVGPDVSPLALLPWLTLVVLLAYLSWKFVEKPFRNKDKMSTKSTLRSVGFSGAVLLLASSIIQIPATSYAKYTVGNTKTVTVAQLENRLSPNYGVNRVCSNFLKYQSACTSGTVTGGPTVALWGDSFSMHIVQGLQQSPTKAKFIAQTLITCNPIYGIAPKNSANGMSGAANCNKTNTAFFNYLLSAKARSTIRTVILSSHWENIILKGKTTLDSKGALSTDSTKPHVALQNTIDRLKAVGYRVVVVSSPAYVSKDTGACLKTAVIRRKNIAACDFPMSSSSSLVSNALLQRLSAKANKFINLTTLMCPKLVCQASVGNVLIFRDKYHISREGSAYLGRTHDLMGLALK